MSIDIDRLPLSRSVLGGHQAMSKLESVKNLRAYGEARKGEISELTLAAAERIEAYERVFAEIADRLRNIECYFNDCEGNFTDADVAIAETWSDLLHMARKAGWEES